MESVRDYFVNLINRHEGLAVIFLKKHITHLRSSTVFGYGLEKKDNHEKIVFIDFTMLNGDL